VLHPGKDRELRLVDATELLGARMHVDERLPWLRHVDERVPRGRHLSKPRADHEQHVGVTNTLRKCRVDPDADVSRVGR